MGTGGTVDAMADVYLTPEQAERLAAALGSAARKQARQPTGSILLRIEAGKEPRVQIKGIDPLDQTMTVQVVRRTLKSGKT
jgi:hypothetical protein